MLRQCCVPAGTVGCWRPTALHPGPSFIVGSHYSDWLEVRVQTPSWTQAMLSVSWSFSVHPGTFSDIASNYSDNFLCYP